jgi:hypothetical protein
MWELLQKILKQNVTPNQCFLLFSIYNKTTPSSYEKSDYDVLIELGYIKDKKITTSGMKVINYLDSYFTVKKKKTEKELLGEEGLNNIKAYRELFPKGKLPSGVPARNNIKILTENFRWFFGEYDYSWEEILNATRMYVNEYRANNYLYMNNSQYFISKQDKHKVKTSKLSDYCDMIRDGVSTEQEYFKEKVV